MHERINLRKKDTPKDNTLYMFGRTGETATPSMRKNIQVSRHHNRGILPFLVQFGMSRISRGEVGELGGLKHRSRIHGFNQIWPSVLQ